MHIDPILPLVVGLVFIILMMGLFFKWIHQPEIIGYLIAGVIIGPNGIAFITETDTINHLGSLGVTLLLFFIGMEISPRNIISRWKVAIIGTLLQIFFSLLIVWLIGQLFDWSLKRVILLGFIISLSSTAVVLKLLKDRNELNTPVGNDVLTILIAQDLAIVPMLIILGLLGGTELDTKTLSVQLVGALIIIIFTGWLITREHIRLPLPKRIREDPELEVFIALLACFGIAFITGMLQLSTALGAFIGGILVSTARETDWVHNSLEPFKTVFVAIFFVSIGLMIDIEFIMLHWFQVSLLVIAVLVSNTFINAGALFALNGAWATSLLAGAMLAQIGEFSFVLVAVGFHSNIISDYVYQVTIATIAITLILSSFWIGGTRKIINLITNKQLNSN